MSIRGYEEDHKDRRRVVFLTHAGDRVPAVSAEQMREVDRLATQEFGLSLLQMMENAGRNLASVVLDLLDVEKAGSVLVLAGKGGNGGGAICAARHLKNRGVHVRVLPSAPQEQLSEATGVQIGIFLRDDGEVLDSPDPAAFAETGVVVDGLVGYGLTGPPSGRVAELIALTNRFEGPVVSLDVPSGVDATTGQRPGAAVVPTHILTLALPKTGLAEQPGALFLGDIGIPSGIWQRVGVDFAWPERRSWVVELLRP